MSDATYDRLKFIALVLLPAAATLYAAIDVVAAIGAVDKVLPIVVAVETFLGTVLGISNLGYKQEVENQPNSALIVSGEGEVYAEFAFDPTDARDGQEFTFRVIRPQGKHSL